MANGIGAGKSFFLNKNQAGPPVLDGLSTGAAFSLRRLYTSYSGPVIKVRRESDNQELDIEFSGNKLDTQTLLSFCSGTNGVIKTWYDQSGNLKHATQTTQAAQPRIVTSGVLVKNQYNNNPAIKMKINTTLYSLTTSLSITSGSYSINCVYDAFGGNRAVSGGNNWLMGTYGSGNYRIYNGNWINGTILAVLNKPICHTAITTVGVGCSSYVKNSLDGSNSTVGYIGSVNMGAAGAYAEGHGGNIQELVCFSYALSDTDRNKIEQNQMRYYKIQT